MKNMKYVYASLMAIITVILLLGNNIVKDTFEKVFAFSESPITVTGGVVQLSANNQNTCALTSSGGVKCWGWNMQGQLGGVGIAGANSLPLDVVGVTTNIKSIDVGNDHSCGVTITGEVKCWGNNSEWERGGPNVAPYSTPANIPNASGITLSSAGSNFSCALTSGGGVKCWGQNNKGQLGNGTTSATGSVSDVSGLGTGIASIAAGWEHACALTSGGGVKCWGNNDFGQLGDSSTNSSNTPVDVVGLSSGVTDLSSGFLYSCALMSSGSVKCWGYNHEGQLGNNGTGNQLAPVDVTSITGALEIKTGYDFSCVRLATGVKCWGRNTDGQLGNGNTGSSLSPVSVTGLGSENISLTLGAYHACVIQNNGGVKCWGRNTDGQLGDGTLSGRTSPVSVLNSSGSSPIILFSTGTLSGGGLSGSPTIVSPTGTINTTQPNFSGSGGSGATRIEIWSSGTLTGILIASGSATSTGYNVPALLELLEGPNSFYVTGFDSLGASGSTVTGSVIVDTTPPAMPIISSHASGATVTSQNFTFTGTAETGSTVKVSILSGSTYTGAVTSSGNWSIPVNLAVGTSYATFTATDTANNNSTGVTLTIIVNPPATTPTIVAPTGYINTDSPAYIGSGGTNTTRIEIWSAGTLTGMLLASGSVTSTGYNLASQNGLPDGQSTFYVTAFNALGYSGTTVTGSVFVDPYPPADPIVLSHSSGAVINGQSFTLTGMAETGSTVRITISTGNVYTTLTSSTGTWSTLVNFPVGISYPKFTATDNAGNTSTGLTLTITTLSTGDTTAPAAPVITSHTTGMSVSGSLTLSGTAEAWSTVGVYFSGTLISSAQSNVSGIWTTTVNLSLAGQNTLAVYATDAAGNRSSPTGITLYSLGGTSFSGITIASPIDGSTFSYSNIVASGTGTAGNTLIVSTPSGNITSLINSNGTWSVQVSLVSGSNLLTFYERTTNGVLSIGINRTVTYSQGGGNTGNTGTIVPTDSMTPIGSYIPSKNDPSVQDKGRLTQLPSSNVCVLDEHVKLNRIVTSDIKGNWAEGYIRTLIRFWVIKNTDKFYPAKSITRAEFLALVIRSLRCNYSVDELDYAVTASYEDVPEGHWANKYLALAEQYGWLPSDSSSIFRPDNFITRAEAMDIVAGATGLYDSEGSAGFDDISYLSEAVQDAILTAEKYDIIQGIQHFSSWYFYPDHPLTRAEAAKIIQRTFVR